MTVTPAKESAPTGIDFRFSDHDFQMIAAQANLRYGLSLQPSKKPLVYSRLAKRLRALQVASFEDYCALLQRPEGEAEQGQFLSALTTNVTHFFREVHHFDYLRDIIAPRLLEKCKKGQAVRLWSSACSSGQEAYCMTAALLAASPEFGHLDAKVLATDLDPQMVQAARQGRFPADQLNAIPQTWRSLMMSHQGPHDGQIVMNETLRRMISFGELNLIGDWPMRRKIDVIFCRNAAIYFDKTTQAKLWQRFGDALTEDGHLMIGHSERLSGPALSMFSSVGITTYQKETRAAQPPNHAFKGANSWV